MSDRGLWITRRQVSTVRASVLVVWLIVIATTPYAAYSALPHALLVPYGIGHVLLFDSRLVGVLFAAPMLSVLKSTAIAGCVWALLRPPHGPLLHWLLFLNVLALDLISKATGGYTNHAQSIPLFMLFVLTCFCDTQYLSLPELLDGRCRDKTTRPIESPARYASIAWLLAIVVVIPYTYTGLHRLLSGGVDLFRGDPMLSYVASSSRSFAAYPSWLPDISSHRYLLNFGFVVVTLLEVCSVGVLLSSWFRQVWVLGLLGFHLSTLVLMNVLFWENVVLIVTLFGWTSLKAQRGTWLGASTHDRPANGTPAIVPSGTAIPSRVGEV